MEININRVLSSTTDIGTSILVVITPFILVDPWEIFVIYDGEFTLS